MSVYQAHLQVVELNRRIAELRRDIRGMLKHASPEEVCEIAHQFREGTDADWQSWKDCYSHHVE